MGQARDEAGNIWETDAQGSPVRLVKSAQSGVMMTDPKAQYGAPKAAAEAAGSQATAAIDTAKVPYAADMAKAERDQKVADARVATQKADETTANNALATMTANSQVHGDAYLQKYVPPAMWNVVKAYARGDLGSRSGGLSTSMLPIIQHAMNYDPSTTGTNFPARVKMQSDLAGNQPGTAGGALRSMEQMLLHGSNVLTTGQALNNYGPGLLGTIGNVARTGYEQATSDPTVNAYNQEVKNYAPESQKGVAGAAGIGAEREERAAGYAASMPQASRAAALQADARMAFERIGAVNDQYKRLMGHDITDQMSPAAQKAYNLIMAGGYDQQGKPLYPAAGWTSPSEGGPQDPGVGPSPPDGTLTSDGKFVDDPALQGVNAKVAQMIGEHRNASEIRSYLNTVRPGLGDNVANVEESVAFAKQHPNQHVGVNIEKTWARASAVSKALGNAAMSPFGAAAIGAGDMATFGLADNLTSDPAMTRALMSGVQQQNPTAYTLGQLAGGVTSGLGLEAGVGRAGLEGIAGNRVADALLGAGYSAGSADDPNESRVGAALMGGASGFAGGALGRGASRVAGRMATGVRDAGRVALDAAGVRMTPGQILGGGWKGTEDRLAGLPIVGDAISARRREGVQDFNKAAFDQGLAPINGNTQGAIAETGIQRAQDAVGGAYDNALDGVNLQTDEPYRQAMSSLPQQVANIPGVGPEVHAGLDAIVSPMFGPGGSLRGSDVQAIDRGLEQLKASYRGASHPLYATHIAPAIDAVGDQIEGLVARQSPGMLPAYRAAKDAYRNVSVLSDAVLKGANTGGEFMPSQLGAASISNTKNFGGRNAAAAGNRPFFDLQRAGQDVLPSKIPDSGTAGRLVIPALVGAATGGGSYASDGDGASSVTRGAVAAALAAAPYSPAARALVQKALLSERPAMVSKAGQQLLEYNRIAGLLAAPAAIDAANQ